MAKRRISFLLILLAAAASTASPGALAQPAPPPPAAPVAPAPPTAEELASARQLFATALEAEDKGRFAEAIAVYERIARIAVSPVLYFRMASCHESLGHVVAAVNAFELAAQEAERKRDPDVAKEAKAHLDKLRPRTARLSIHVPEGAEGVAITIDDHPVSAALAGAPLLVDPGQRHVVVRAQSHEKAFEADVTAAPGEPSTVTADLGPRKIAAPPPPPPSSAPIAPVASASAPPPLPPPPAPDRLAAYIAGGGTAICAILAVGTGLAAHAKFDEFLVENANPKPGSLGARQRLHDSGQALGIASTVFSAVAVAGAGAAIFLYAFPPAPRPKRAAWSPWIAPGTGGLVVEGAL